MRAAADRAAGVGQPGCGGGPPGGGGSNPPGWGGARDPVCSPVEAHLRHPENHLPNRPRDRRHPEWEGVHRMAGGNGVSGDLLEQFKSTVQRRDAVGLRSLLRAVPALSAHVNDPIFDFNSRAVIQARQDPDVVEVLLEHGADLNLKSEWWAGGFGVLDETEPEAARFLIERGAVLDACSAAGLGLLDRLREIVAADSSRVNEWGGDGKRPLHFAATRAVVDFLVSRGADLEARDLDHGGTPAEWAVRERPEVCRRLLWLGAKGSIHLSVALNDRGTVRDLLARDPALVHAWTSGTAPGGHVHTYTGIGVPSQPLHVAARFDRPQLAA
ncbi:MAG: hypothetical protein FJX77_09510, partial [Armatimonadetes bacterium]|nr:hypothetical protein [Armatimonadota bacterium]